MARLQRSAAAPAEGGAPHFAGTPAEGGAPASRLRRGAIRGSPPVAHA
jgi:hypothetical protein